MLCLLVLPSNWSQPHRQGLAFSDIEQLFLFELSLPSYEQGSYLSASHPEPYKYAESIMRKIERYYFISVVWMKIKLLRNWMSLLLDCMGCWETQIKDELVVEISCSAFRGRGAGDEARTKGSSDHEGCLKVSWDVKTQSGIQAPAGLAGK